MAKATKKTGKGAIKPIPSDAFNNQQLSLFQGFLANTDENRDLLSNAVDLWDCIPRFSTPRQNKLKQLKTAAGFLPTLSLPFVYRGTSYTAEIIPAKIEVKKEGKTDYKEIYPGAREELIEHALRRLAVEKNSGFFDGTDFRSGVSFTLYRLRQELANQGHAMTYEGLTEGLDVLHHAFLQVTVADSDPNDPSMISQPYLPALGKVNRKGRASDPDAKWFVQFHGLVTDSMNKITYRQFNYQRLMKCNSQLSRWLLSQLVLKYTQAGITNTFDMRFSTIARDSFLLGYTRERAAIEALDEAWEELKYLGALAHVLKAEQLGIRSKIEDVIYTLTPSREFITEQKAANKRASDSRNGQAIRVAGE